MVVTEAEWHARFGDAKTLTDARMEIDDRAVNVVGVLQRGADLSFVGDVWMPFASETDLESVNQRNAGGGLADRGSAGLVVKLRAHVKAASLEAQLASVAASLTSRYGVPGSNAPAYVLQLQTIRPKPVRTDEFGVLMLLIGAGVLAIAAANVAALALARGLTRRRDYALRIALGASRRAVGAEVFAETALLCTLGALLGIPFALALIGALTSIVPA